MRIEWIDRKLQLIKNELGLGPVLGSAALFLAASALLFVVLWFVDSAPPSTITLIGGPADSLFQHNADKYSAILARNGVRLKIIPSQGSLENLVHLSDPSFHNDVGLVQGGLIQSGFLSGLNTSSLVSLGSVFYEPLLVFYKDKKEVDRLVQFKGKKLAIDLPGSGTHALATTLLKANGIDESDTTTELLDMEAEDGAAELVSGKIDAVFLMGDSASIKLIGSLLRTPGIRLMSFAQADAYTRKFNYLNKIELPEGGIDLGKDIPPHNVTLIGPTVELVARSGLHPALSDLLLEAAHEVHGKAGLLQHQGEFPAPLEHEFRISEDAARYYQSGRSFLYRNLPFWMATLVSRLVVILVPLMVVLIPGLRILPSVYRWRIRSRITKWYGALLELERGLLKANDAAAQAEMLKRLDEIDHSVKRMKVPKMFGDQFYVLRQHITLVRERLKENTQ